MNPLKEYMIPFRGLSVGFHRYEFDIDDRFFETMKNPEIQRGRFMVKVTLEKAETMLTLVFDIEGAVVTECDRCLEDLTLPVQEEATLYVKFGAEMKEESDDVLVLPNTAFQIDISAFINDYITLALPMRKVHAENESEGEVCNEEALEKLKHYSAGGSHGNIWEKLKEIDLNDI